MNLRTPDPAQEDMGLNLTPMIDVVFLLLIFFMLATTFLDPERAVELDLPPTEHAGEEPVATDEIVVNVLEDGSLLLHGQAVSPEELLRSLKQAAARNAQTAVTIRGDRGAAYEHVVQVLDLCHAAGLRNLGLATVEGG